MAHGFDGKRRDGTAGDPSMATTRNALIAPASKARSTSTTFSATSLPSLTSLPPNSSTRATCTSTIKWEEKKKLGTVIVGRR